MVCSRCNPPSASWARFNAFVAFCWSLPARALNGVGHFGWGWRRLRERLTAPERQSRRHGRYQQQASRGPISVVHLVTPGGRTINRRLMKIRGGQRTQLFETYCPTPSRSKLSVAANSQETIDGGILFRVDPTVRLAPRVRGWICDGVTGRRAGLVQEQRELAKEAALVETFPSTLFLPVV